MVDFAFEFFKVLITQPGNLIASFVAAFILSIIFGSLLAVILKYIFKKSSILGYPVDGWLICGFIVLCFFDFIEIIKVVSGASQDLSYDIPMIMSFSFLLIIYGVILIIKR